MPNDVFYPIDGPVHWTLDLVTHQSRNLFHPPGISIMQIKSTLSPISRNRKVNYFKKFCDGPRIEKNSLNGIVQNFFR